MGPLKSRREAGETEQSRHCWNWRRRGTLPTQCSDLKESISLGSLGSRALVGVLGVCAGMGPVLTCPWGICIDRQGNVLVADWGEQHRILLYPAQGAGWPIVNQGLSSPRGLTLLPEGQLVVSDSMHHCVKIYQEGETKS
uniref:NHL repeat containing 4 n=1 Tax=Salarias fasciatus TaxID=181472 RepID=A0A672H6I2_SALFA